jgi:hypothetical protein
MIHSMIFIRDAKLWRRPMRSEFVFVRGEKGGAEIVWWIVAADYCCGLWRRIMAADYCGGLWLWQD